MMGFINKDILCVALKIAKVLGIFKLGEHKNCAKQTRDNLEDEGNWVYAEWMTWSLGTTIIRDEQNRRVNKTEL